MNEFTQFSYYNIAQILKLVHKKELQNINLYQRSVTDIRGRIYSSIAGGIIVQNINLTLNQELGNFENRRQNQVRITTLTQKRTCVHILFGQKKRSSSLMGWHLW